MIPLNLAKLLLFVALTLGPKDNHTILIETGKMNAVWRPETQGWNLVQNRPAPSSWPANGLDVSTADLNSVAHEDRITVRQILRHDWSHDSVLYLDNGDRVEKRGEFMFYTVSPGAANQVVYTMITMENGTMPK